jgi:hypothetical protein
MWGSESGIPSAIREIRVSEKMPLVCLVLQRLIVSRCQYHASATMYEMILIHPERNAKRTLNSIDRKDVYQKDCEKVSDFHE